ncbi:MAG: anaerobic ribonucleoside-triphosphate reductase [Candidatus Bathyarchaeota archaeon]
MKITVYSLPDCPKCDKLKDYLKSQKIEFEADWFDTERARHWSRITGYYTDVTGWNEGKRQELRDRYRVSI